MKNWCLLILVLMVYGCGVQSRIVDRPITFNEEREALTREYLKNRYGLDQDSITIDPKMVVLHWTEIPSLEDSFKAFENPTLPNHRAGITSASGLNVSSQFLVDQDGTIYRLMPENVMARHVIGLNHTAIGVENVGGTPEMPLTDKQVKANIALVKYLAKKYDINYLIGHYEYTNFEGHPLWLEVDDGYRTQKIDPGQDFMQKVREGTRNLNFLPIPIK